MELFFTINGGSSNKPLLAADLLPVSGANRFCALKWFSSSLLMKKVNLVISRSMRKPVAATIALLAVSIAGISPAFSAPTPAALVEAINNAKVLPASVSLNARYSMGEVALYMYRGNVPDKDLKIDSVLITKALYDKFGQDIKSVQLNFYDKSNKAQIRQCTVSQTHINSFATKQISQQQLLDMLAIARMSAGGSSGSGGSYGNAAKDAVLAATYAPGFKATDRGKMLLDIQEIARRGGNFQPLFAKFKQIDDRIKSGETEEIIPQFNQLIPLISVEQAACNQRASAASMEAANQHNRAEVHRAMMAYMPRNGYALHRRMAIWARIKQLDAAGHDVSPFMQDLLDRVDAPMGTRDIDAMKAGIIRLEQQLGIPVSFVWQ